MGLKKNDRPVTEEDEQRVRELHSQGKGRNAIARELGRGPRTVSVIADRLNLSFDRTATAVATEARKADAKARRTAIIEALYDVVEDDLAYLRDDTFDLVEVSMGAPVRYNTNRLPAQDRKALITGISTATTALTRLEALEGDPANGEARSMLLDLSDALRLAAGPPEDDTGED
ncbi:helix-turn-helix domain-containing protein [Streptomyces sp. NPDC056543]|uniref:helix-turn-helix domain-containing protein n=1 Tax=unclassified Streptomyces TaxID=2593676 RepID=UPI0036C2616D